MVILDVTVAEPLPIAEICPLLLTVATLVLLLLQVTLAPLGDDIAWRVSLSPTIIERLDVESERLTVRTVTEQISE